MSAALAAAVDGLDWPRIANDLDAQGFAATGALLSPQACAALIAGYETERYRSTVVMRRHGYGEGEYRYFAYPLPETVQTLRARLYPHLAPLANRWAGMLKEDRRFPDTLAAFSDECHRAGQARPTPLVLRYGPGDYNRLHQDLYGALHFPFQAAFLLNEPGEDFEGGEFVLTEQTPRRQSKVEIVPLRRGHSVIFAVNHRPAQGARGIYRATLRHGVSRVRSGARHTLGVIFHDAT